MNQSMFVVSRFENRNGSFSWRVDGRLNGVRIRRNFKTQEEACAEKAMLEIKVAQMESGRPNQIATFLTLEQVHDAEAAFRRLQPAGLSLLFSADFTLANYAKPAREMLLADAAKEYLAMKERERDQHALSNAHLRNIEKDMKHFVKLFKGEKLAALTPPRLTDYCQRGSPSLKTVSTRRGIIGTFFKFAYQHDWIAANPVDKIPRTRLPRRRASADTLAAAKARELMQFVETYRNGELVTFYALCLFGGIRPCLRNGEVAKLRPEHIRIEDGTILITPEVSKTHEKRVITIQPNLAAWLRAYPLEKHPIVPSKHIRNTRAEISKKFELTHDVLRHTFISMFVAKTRSLGEAALQAGNSEAIIRRHYLDLKSSAEAEEFFNILPGHVAAISKKACDNPVSPPSIAA